MRRIVLWALSTLTVLVLLFGYHTSTSSTLETTPAAVADPVSEPATSDPTTPDAGADADTGSGTASDGGTFTGDVAQTRWGPVQVAITVADGAITDVAVPQYPDGNPRDVEINDYALPVLVQETLDAQSAQIDMVSGATVTSEGYLTSLQSALDRAGL